MLFLEISQNSQENTSIRVERDSGTGVFLRILRNFKERCFYRTLLGDCFLYELQLR